jgi:hypothetical protein
MASLLMVPIRTEHIPRAIPLLLDRVLFPALLLKDLRCERTRSAGTTERLFLFSSNLHCDSLLLRSGFFVLRVGLEVVTKMFGSRNF